MMKSFRYQGRQSQRSPQVVGGPCRVLSRGAGEGHRSMFRKISLGLVWRMDW